MNNQHIRLTPCVLKALGSNSLKVQVFQGNGFKHQRAPPYDAAETTSGGSRSRRNGSVECGDLNPGRASTADPHVFYSSSVIAGGCFVVMLFVTLVLGILTYTHMTGAGGVVGGADGLTPRGGDDAIASVLPGDDDHPTKHGGGGKTLDTTGVSSDEMLAVRRCRLASD